jgi:hypothetical protein
MSGAFVKYRGEKKIVEYFGSLNLKEGDNLKDLEVDWSIIGNLPSRLSVGGVDWICLDQDRDKWKALVNAVMKLRVQ